MENPEELLPIEDPKPKKGLLHYFNISEKITGRTGKIGGLILLLIPFVLYFTKGKEIQAANEAEATIIEFKDCRTDDEITGTIILNENIVKGGFVELTVRNKYTKNYETKINEVEVQDGTFKFYFCKSTTDFVEFDTRLLDRKDHFINKYTVDAIPDSIILTPKNQ